MVVQTGAKGSQTERIDSLHYAACVARRPIGTIMAGGGSGKQSQDSILGSQPSETVGVRENNVDLEDHVRANAEA